MFYEANFYRTCECHAMPHSYQRKKGNQQRMKTPIIIPKVRAALCSRFILIIFLSLVGVCSRSTSVLCRAFEELVVLFTVSPEG